MAKKNLRSKKDFDLIKIGLASPDTIEDWSHGEITMSETINYRTQKPEKGGLFDEKVFGPATDSQCACGKYKGMRYQGITCEKCGVEITRSTVRRQRMGHITLATPIAHIWYFKKIPSQLALLLDVKSIDLQKVIYFASYIVTSIDEAKKKKLLDDVKDEYDKKSKGLQNEKAKSELHRVFQMKVNDIKSIELGQIIDESDFIKYYDEYSNIFKAGIGGEAIFNVLKNFDVLKEKKAVQKELETANKSSVDKLNKRLYLLNMFHKTGAKPEWMFFVNLPVIPAGLRPMVPLDGGRYASSDLNDLYRRVINRNNRLKRLIDTQAPEVILRNEKRILQEAVDSLLDSSIGRTGDSYNSTQDKKLKSLSEYLSGKSGSFRNNLLGKRVDYSGRSVIVVGPQLKIDECGIPKKMALELFKPFIISKLIEREIAHNITTASKMIQDHSTEEVWSILDEVIKYKYVLLNRQPTLHRQSVQAFRPVLIESNSIQLHPLVCAAFNADFDGDSMAVYVPLSDEAQAEAREIMNAKKNIINPGTGKVLATPSKGDIVLGCFWATAILPNLEGEGKMFSSPEEAITAYHLGLVDVRAEIIVSLPNEEKYKNLDKKSIKTSVGRIMFNNILPEHFPFINKRTNKGLISSITEDLIKDESVEDVSVYLDNIKDLGFHYSTISGVTFSLSDIVSLSDKGNLINEGIKQYNKIYSQYNKGLISTDERRRMTVELWQGISEDIKEKTSLLLKENSSIYDIIASGSRGTTGNVSLMAGMRGVVSKSSGEDLEQPVTSSLKEGHNAIEYFMSAHGTRKTQTDTALKTKDSGYLTRRLFDAAQEVTIQENDCSTKRGFNVYRDTIVKTSFAQRIFGKFVQEDVVGENGKVLVKKGEVIQRNMSETIEKDETIKSVNTRSPITCNTKGGICAKCYGLDLAGSKLIEQGESVGVIAAQSIGEPGTQLTMRTAHSGGVSTIGGDITDGLPRVEEIFEKRVPKSPAIIAHLDGVVDSINKEGVLRVIKIKSDKAKATVKDTTYTVPTARIINVKVGDRVEKGQILTDGSLNLEEYDKYAGVVAAQEYMISELEKVYNLQGITISPKHFEILIRQMYSRVEITDPADSEYTVGTVIEEAEMYAKNQELKEANKSLIIGKKKLLGVKTICITRKNFLSSASFENTIKVLIGAAIKGSEDSLNGLKENVITGRLVPVGTGYTGSTKNKFIKEVQKDIQIEEQ